MASITLDDIGKIYPDGTRAVGHVDLVVNDGEFLVLVGPSGCGKSTVLRMIAGLEDISEGKMSIGDKVVNDVPPKDRDIAMVFQNYALYPHMSVYDNMAFGLKLRKMPKDDIDRRVKEAAEVLEITEFLDRKPKALSGGQRQRVAMGRAIVREPKAFLMDEPLSNLDAKLRVQMRTELGRLHQRLGTTTVYVTHDQVEAMTLGHRVAVLRAVSQKRPYNLQQVAPPTELFNNPANLFVAGFSGSPAMNMVYGELELESEGRVFLKFAGHRVYVEKAAIDAHPGIDDYYGKRIVVGLRPGIFEDARVTDSPADRTVRVKTDVNELLGSESYVHFMLDAPPVITPDIEELLADSGTDPESLGDKSQFTGRVSADVPVPDGSELDLVVDTSKLHFFDVDTSDKIGYEPHACDKRAGRGRQPVLGRAGREACHEADWLQFGEQLVRSNSLLHRMDAWPVHITSHDQVGQRRCRECGGARQRRERPVRRVLDLVGGPRSVLVPPDANEDDIGFISWQRAIQRPDEHRSRRDLHRSDRPRGFVEHADLVQRPEDVPMPGVPERFVLESIHATLVGDAHRGRAACG